MPHFLVGTGDIADEFGEEFFKCGPIGGGREIRQDERKTLAGLNFADRWRMVSR
jgi:hypothetical protein